MAKIYQFISKSDEEKIKHLTARLQYEAAYTKAVWLLRSPSGKADFDRWLEKTKAEVKKLLKR